MLSLNNYGFGSNAAATLQWCSTSSLQFYTCCNFAHVSDWLSCLQDMLDSILGYVYAMSCSMAQGACGGVFVNLNISDCRHSP